MKTAEMLSGANTQLSYSSRTLFGVALGPLFPSASAAEYKPQEESILRDRTQVLKANLEFTVLELFSWSMVFSNLV